MYNTVCVRATNTHTNTSYDREPIENSLSIAYTWQSGKNNKSFYLIHTKNYSNFLAFSKINKSLKKISCHFTYFKPTTPPHFSLKDVKAHICRFVFIKLLPVKTLTYVSMTARSRIKSLWNKALVFCSMLMMYLAHTRASRSECKG